MRGKPSSNRARLTPLLIPLLIAGAIFPPVIGYIYHTPPGKPLLLIKKWLIVVMRRVMVVLASRFPECNFRKMAAIPSLHFEPGYSLDLAYAEKLPNLEQSWAELEQWLPSIWKTWKSEKRILETTVELLGKGFCREELSVALIVSSLPSMSYPLVISVSSFLKSAENPKPDFYFFSTLYHELLHRYLNEQFSDVLSRSLLLRKHIDAREPRGVIAHIHLFALQKAIYLKLHKDDELQRIIQWNSEAEDPAYARAWDIVNRLDGFEAYVAELA